MCDAQADARLAVMAVRIGSRIGVNADTLRAQVE
jgi:hypothetical protein